MEPEECPDCGHTIIYTEMPDLPAEYSGASWAWWSHEDPAFEHFEHIGWFNIQLK